MPYCIFFNSLSTCPLVMIGWIIRTVLYNNKNYFKASEVFRITKNN